MARILTYPSKVTVHNLEQLRNAVLKGPDGPSGANFVQSASSGFKKFLKYANPEDAAKKLRIGDIVERHLIDGE